MSNYTKIAVKGASAVLSITIAAAALGYVARLILARNLSVEEFGLFYAVFAFLSLLGVFKSLGFDRSLIKFIPEFAHKKQLNQIKTSIAYVGLIQLITNTIVIVAVYLLASFLAGNYFQDPRADAVLKILALAFFVDSFTQVVKFSLQGFKKMGHFSGIDFFRMIIIIGIISIGFYFDFGLKAVLVAYILAPLILLIVYGHVLTKKVFPKYKTAKIKFNKKLFKKIARYSVFTIATAVGMVVLGYTDMVLLTYFSGLTAVAMYSVALPTAKLFLYFPRAIAGILLPLTSELLAKREKKLVQEGYELLYKYILVFIVPLALAFASFSQVIIWLFYGSDYLPASITLQILSIGMIFAAIYVININFFSAANKPEINSVIIYSAALFNLVGNIILIPKYGIIGAAITTSISYFIMMAVGLYKIRKYLKTKLPIWMWTKISLAGGVFFVSILFLKQILSLHMLLEAVIAGAISGIIYLILLFVLNVIKIEETKQISKRVFKQ